MSFEKLQANILKGDCAAVVDQLSDLNEEQRGELRQRYRVLRAALQPRLGPNPKLRLEDVQHLVESKTEELEDIGFQPSSRNASKISSLLAVADLGLLEPDEIFSRGALESNESIAAKILLDRDPVWLSQKLTRLTNDWAYYIPLGIWMHCCAAGKVAWWDKGALPHILLAKLADCHKQHPEVTREAIRNHAPLRQAIERFLIGDFSGVKKPIPIFPAKDWKQTIAWMAKEKLLDRSKIVPELIGLINPPDPKKRFSELHSVYAILLSAIKPSASELQPHVNEIALMFSHPDRSVVKFALDWLQVMLKDGNCELAPVIAELNQALKLKPKTSPLKTLKLLPLLCEYLGSHDRVNELAIAGLEHPQVDVQNLAAMWLSENSKTLSSSALEEIKLRKPNLAPTSKKILQQFASTKAAKPSGTAKATVGEHPANPASSDALEPIEDLATLLERVIPALRNVHSGDEIDQIIAGFLRFPLVLDGADAEVVKHSEAIAKLLADHVPLETQHRVPKKFPKGLLDKGMRALMHAWLGEPVESLDYLSLTDELPYRLATRIAAGKQTVLLSTPTHPGGWIAPETWCQRLSQIDADLTQLDLFDLELSLLRLATDGRREAFKNLSGLPAVLKVVAECAIGEQLDVATLPELDPDWTGVWIAAMRCRDPFGILPIKGTPLATVHGYDTHLPTDYAFSMQEGTPDLYETLVDISAGTLAAKMTNTEKDSLVNEAMEASGIEDPVNAVPEELKGFLEAMMRNAIAKQDPTKMIITKLHGLAARSEQWHNTDWFTEYLATFWPAKLDWYFALGTKAMAGRSNRKKASSSQPAGFLLPLMRSEREVTPMAARVLWFATASKDQNSASAATTMWSKLIEDGRWDVSLLCVALSEVDQHRWIVYKRVASVLGDVAQTSTQHQIAIAKTIEGMLATFESPPRDLAALLEVLLQANTTLSRAVGAEMKAILSSYKTGKPKKLARALLDI